MPCNPAWPNWAIPSATRLVPIFAAPPGCKKLAGRFFLLSAGLLRHIFPSANIADGVSSPPVNAALLAMPTFVVSVQLPESFDAEFMALIPRHRAFINQMLNEKVIETYAISSDRRRGWVTINANNEAAVRRVVEQFPLFSYLHGVEIDELFIFDTVASRFPHISLN